MAFENDRQEVNVVLEDEEKVVLVLMLMLGRTSAPLAAFLVPRILLIGNLS